jgi:hypothetical protein
VPAQTGQAGAGFVQETRPLITTTVESEMMPTREIERSSEGNSKLSSPLNQLLEAYQRGGLAEAKIFAATHMLVLKDDLVQVEVIAIEEAAVPIIEETVEAVGGENQGHYKAVVQALVPIDSLESLAQRSDVQVIREPQRAVIP